MSKPQAISGKSGKKGKKSRSSVVTSSSTQDTEDTPKLVLNVSNVDNDDTVTFSISEAGNALPGLITESTGTPITAEEKDELMTCIRFKLFIKFRMDIHLLALRSLNLFAYKYDKRFRNLKLVTIKDETPSIIPEDSALLKTINWKKLEFLESLENPSDPPYESSSLFSDTFTFSKKNDKETSFWKIISHGVEYLSGVIAVVIHLLKTEYAHHHFLAHALIDGEVKEIELQFDNIMIKVVKVIPKEVLWFDENIEEFSHLAQLLNHGYITHFLLSSRDNYVIDMTSIQFGMKGKYREIIGRVLEPFESYRSRFPGKIISDMNFKIVELSEDELKSLELGMESNTNANEEKKNNKDIIRLIGKDIIEEFDVQDKWCNFCGKILVSIFRCNACKMVTYCSKPCQTSDWKGHKLWCTFKKAENA